MLRLALVVLALSACQTKAAEKEKEKAPDPQPVAKVEPAKPLAAPMVELAAFDKSCKEATDCVLVKRAGCDPCACAMDAIASKEMAKFDEAAGKLECPPPDLDRQMACGGCEKQAATCTNGQCVIAPPATP